MYIGRFAPSPTGLLHIGSLLTALASYADARANGGKWLVRMEDLDPPREMAGADAHILHTLEAFGFEWTAKSPTKPTERVVSRGIGSSEK